jgi:hypothetical protein
VALARARAGAAQPRGRRPDGRARRGPLTLELLILAVLSAFWPLLIAVVVVALRSPQPKKLLLAFYAGALLTTVTVGLVIVRALQTTSLVTSSRSTFDPVVYVVAGAAALAIAAVLRRRGLMRPREPRPEEETVPSWWERMLQRGAGLAFVAGIVLDVFPGVLPFVALKNIAELDLSLGATAAVILAFYLVMFAIIEVPLVGYVVAPQRAEAWATQFNRWLDRNAGRLGVFVLAGAGAYLVVRGVVSALTS